VRQLLVLLADEKDPKNAWQLADPITHLRPVAEDRARAREALLRPLAAEAEL
jgi:hypothetical protein